MENINRSFCRPFRTGDAVRVGVTVVAQFIHEPSLDRWCHAVETLGGIIHQITDEIVEPSKQNGNTKRQRVYTAVATVDDGLAAILPNSQH